MEMNASTRPEALRGETDHVQEHCANPSDDNVPHELCSNEQTLGRNALRPCAPDEDASEIYFGGAGI
jgi:hypothetical protein